MILKQVHIQNQTLKNSTILKRVMNVKIKITEWGVGSLLYAVQKSAGINRKNK